MAYTDYDFYKNEYFGDVLVLETFPRWATRASDWLDTVTFNRLVNSLPSDEFVAKKVQKCVCALGEIFFQLDEAQKSASFAISERGEDTKKTVKSVSSGSESITYTTPSEQINSLKLLSAVYSVANDKVRVNELLYGITKEYLSGAIDDKGVSLLYAGM